MAFPGKQYAPPGVYTQTLFENPVAGALETLKIPVFIGEGNESLFQRDLEVVRGSSSFIDQRKVDEDETGRAVVSISSTGQVTIGNFNGILDKFLVRNFPIVNGDGSGTVSNNRADVSVTIDGQPIVVRSVDGAKGIVQIAQPPAAGQQVRCTYYFKRTDTLITDNVSDQVPNRMARIRALTGIMDVDVGGTAVIDLHGDVLNSQGVVTVPGNNILNVNLNGTVKQIVLPPRSNYTVAQVGSALTAATAGVMSASRFTNNYGESALQLVSNHSLVVLDGSANAALGLATGQADTRVVTFTVFQGPIVDGSNGGVTTTDPANVTVKVAGVQVIPTAVDGANRTVTLPQAPKAGATVAITYFFNAWQDTFDWLAHINVTSVDRCGVAPGSSSYIQGADFILQDDKILWGTAVATRAGVTTAGSTLFHDTQITTTLIDNKTFLSECSSVVETSGGVAVASQVKFELPAQPTLGNGRDTPLGQSLFQTVSNGRIDLPVDRPDVIDTYWGWDVQDALKRGKGKVLTVDGITITLQDPVPVGAKVYASFWYNLLTDNTYTLTCIVPGTSGVGTYAVMDVGNNSVYGATFDIGTKGVGLTGVTIEFPSGSEYTPDLRFESMSGTQFTGPVEEIVTVQFGSKVATPAKYTVPGGGDYEFVENFSDHLHLKVHGISAPSSAGLNLTAPSAVALSPSFFASLLGDEVEYTGGAVALAGQAYDITASEQLTLGIDDATVMVKTNQNITNQTVQFFADAINEAASGHQSTAAAGGVATVTLNATPRSNVDNYYVNWKIVMGNGGAAAGDVRTVTAYDGTTGIATVDSAFTAPPVITNPYYIYNPAARSSMKGTTQFNGPVTLGVGLHNRLRFNYVGNVATTGALEAILTAGPFASPSLLATEVQTRIAAQVAALLPGPLTGLVIECVANANGQLEFRIQLPGVDSVGYLQFLNAAGGAATDFAVLAGLDTAAAAGNGQAALLQGPVAKTYMCPAAGAMKPYDRLILRNRLLPGGASISHKFMESQTLLTVMAGNTKSALVTGMYGTAGRKAVMEAASVMGQVGVAGGMNVANAEPQVVFYDGTGTAPANNVFSFEMDGTPVTVTFTPSGATGTATDLGPITAGTSILGQIVTAMAAVPGAPFGAAPAIIVAKYVQQEGAGLRLNGTSVHPQARIVIGDGTANTSLGFGSGATVLRTTVPARKLASALMANFQSTFTTMMQVFTTGTVGTFGNPALNIYGLASVKVDDTGREYLYLQDGPVLAAALGPGSSIGLFDTALGIKNALAPTTGLSVVSGDGATGDPALNGFFVISNNPAGSGSSNDSILNDEVGQDGTIGQTYRDKVTGLTFTILPRGWANDPNGPWIAYPVGGTATFRFRSSKTFITNANIPNNALNGVEMTVSNTLSVGVGDTATVNTYERGGQEPKVGDVYYVSYTYAKQDFTTAFFTKMSSIEQAYGVISPDNPVTLAAYLSILNGAMLIGIKQVLREPGSGYASLTSYRNAIDELEGVLPGQIQPDMITPLRGDSTDLFQYLKRSDEIQSSIRYRSERTSIIGMAAGSLPAAASTLAQTLSHTRMRLVYPDMVVVTLSDAIGNLQDSLIDGPFLAAGLTGSVCSPNVDVATPWTGRRLVGYTQLGRTLDAVEQNQLAVTGITILEDKPPFVRVRHGLTTDMTNILTKLPTIVLIADEVQRQSRSALDSFIGIKFLPGVLSQIEGRLAMVLKAMVAAAIITAYVGVKAKVAADDPTVAEVEAFYSPVFPLLYIVLTFHLRSSL